MPWHVDKSSECPAGKPWAVIKDADGTVEGCHPSKAKAGKQMAALYANEPGAKRMSENDENIEAMGTGEFVYRATEPEGMRFREEGDGAPVLEGRMMPYGEWTEVDSSVEGHFLERFAPGSLAKTLNERAARIRILFEHGLDFLGRQPIAAFEGFRDEDDGAHYEASLLRGVPDLLVEGLRRGVYGSSIRYRPVKWERLRSPGESDHNPEGLPEHTIREAFIKEFSVVTFPQYEGATAGVRSITDDITGKQLLKDPGKLLELIRTTTEPQHSGREEQEEPAPQRSRSTQPSHDYLNPGKGETPWRL